MKVVDYEESIGIVRDAYKIIPTPKEPSDLGEFDFPMNADVLSDNEVDNWLLRLGAWRGWIMSQISEVESELILYEEVYIIRLGQATAILETDAKKKLLKESLHGKAVSEDTELAELKLNLDILKSKKQLLRGKFEFFDKSYETISRVKTGRGQDRY